MQSNKIKVKTFTSRITVLFWISSVFRPTKPHSRHSNHNLTNLGNKIKWDHVWFCFLLIEIYQGKYELFQSENQELLLKNKLSNMILNKFMVKSSKNQEWLFLFWLFRRNLWKVEFFKNPQYSTTISGKMGERLSTKLLWKS